MRLRSLKYAFSFSEICVFVLQQKRKRCQLSSGEYCTLSFQKVVEKLKFGQGLISVTNSLFDIMFIHTLSTIYQNFSL